MRERRTHVGGGEFHSDIKCKLVVEDGEPWGGGGGGQRVGRGGGAGEGKGVSRDVKVCFSLNEVKMDITAGVQTVVSISLALSPQV